MARPQRALWETEAGSAAAPFTCETDGEQSVLGAVGWRGVFGIVGRATGRVSPGRVYTFRLGGAWQPHGMPRFDAKLDEAQVLQLRTLILSTADSVRPC